MTSERNTKPIKIITGSAADGWGIREMLFHNSAPTTTTQYAQRIIANHAPLKLIKNNSMTEWSTNRPATRYSPVRLEGDWIIPRASGKLLCNTARSITVNTQEIMFASSEKAHSCMSIIFDKLPLAPSHDVFADYGNSSDPARLCWAL